MPKPLTPQEFLALLTRFGVKPRAGKAPPRIGLAVSGGVDSMAMAYLVSRCCAGGVFAKDGVVPYIVDHGARPESTQEAEKVLKVLKEELGFDKARILKLDWSSVGGFPRKERFEEYARKGRYRTLARACVEDKVEKLLLGHQREDQIETVLMRLVSGSGYHGLQGIQRICPIPESAGIWDSWKLQIWRPFLSVSKERLYETCKSAKVKWFEDPTNHDSTFTIRNAIRKLMSDPFQLPVALRPDKILKASEKIAEECKKRDAEAKKIIPTLKPIVDPTAGTLQISIHRSMSEKVPLSVMQRVFQELTAGISPNENINSTKNAHAVLRLFPEYEKRDNSTLDRFKTEGSAQFNANGLLWRRVAIYYDERVDTTGKKYKRDKPPTWLKERLPATRPDGEMWMLYREAFYQGKSPTTVIDPPDQKEDDPTFHLWDGRYWVKIVKPLHPVAVRTLREDDFRRLNPSLDANILMSLSPLDLEQRQILRNTVQQHLPMEHRFTVPIMEINGKVAFLPTLRWGDQNLEYKIRHKAMWMLGDIPGVKFAWPGYRAATKYFPPGKTSLLKELSEAQAEDTRSKLKEIVPDEWWRE